ncbi:competence protein ComEC [Maribacter vaceletii]|uniref:Competence protein ComEC n=1 Tax=Maribacter vaceletii TaxID=1206816 RepID=A0A495EEU0_9FLAO|nr:ComEC/Rec2 family competence protein [Maribacter vaceletii]RKR15276.1 competence protein ComEC [Maribacter vaceletii]
MPLLKFASIKLTLLLVVGILIGTHTKITIHGAFLYTGISLTLLGICFFAIKKDIKHFLFTVFMVCTTISLGVLTTTLNNPLNYSSHYSHNKTSSSKTYTLKITEVLKPNTYYKKYIAEVQAIENKKSSGKILVNISKDSLYFPLHVDDEIKTVASLKGISAPLNPYQFNFRKYMEISGIYHQISLKQEDVIRNKKNRSTLYGFSSKIRNHIIKKLKQAPFGSQELAVIEALLLGQRQDLSDTTYDNYKKAGAVHILAVSGLHIGILLLILEFLLQPLTYLPYGRKIKLVALVFLLWSFALLAGFSASIIRATTMFTFVGYALYLNRPSNTFNILALSMGFILLVINPNLIFQVGFQMSYAAVFTIAWIFPMLQRFWFPKNIVLNKVWQLLSVSIAAQVGVLPISLFYFHQFPSLFFISNILIIPFLGVILGLGILVILLAVANCLPNSIVLVYNTIIYWMNSIVGWVAKQEAFLFSNISFNQLQLVLSYGILILLVTMLSNTTFKKVGYFLASILLWQLLHIYQNNNLQKEQQLWVLHENRNSVIYHQNGTSLTIIASKEKVNSSTLNNYKIEKGIDSVTYKTLLNSYVYNSLALKIIDSTGIYIPRKESAIYLLSNSPKINLDRFIDTVQPVKIIADGSNYKSYITRWRATCKKRKFPFHYTGEKGAYYLE